MAKISPSNLHGIQNVRTNIASVVDSILILTLCGRRGVTLIHAVHAGPRTIRTISSNAFVGPSDERHGGMKLTGCDVSYEVA